MSLSDRIVISLRRTQPFASRGVDGAEFARMFFFFSNGVGLIGSIIISVVLTLVLLKACAM